MLFFLVCFFFSTQRRQHFNWRYNFPQVLDFYAPHMLKVSYQCSSVSLAILSFISWTCFLYRKGHQIDTTFPLLKDS